MTVCVCGPGGLGESLVATEMPNALGELQGREVTLQSGEAPRPAWGYSKPGVDILVVSHEHGPELFLIVLNALANVAEFTGAVGALASLIWQRRKRLSRTEPEQVMFRRTYHQDGSIASEDFVLQGEGLFELLRSARVAAPTTSRAARPGPEPSLAPWTPGLDGKGLLLAGGTLVTWASTDDASEAELHASVCHTLGLRVSDVLMALRITKDGGVEQLNRAADAKEQALDDAIARDDRLTHGSGEPEWDFG